MTITVTEAAALYLLGWDSFTLGTDEAADAAYLTKVADAITAVRPDWTLVGGLFIFAPADSDPATEEQLADMAELIQMIEAYR